VGTTADMWDGDCGFVGAVDKRTVKLLSDNRDCRTVWQMDRWLCPKEDCGDEGHWGLRALEAVRQWGCRVLGQRRLLGCETVGTVELSKSTVGEAGAVGQ
jgi:hypothetical protein